MKRLAIGLAVAAMGAATAFGTAVVAAPPAGAYNLNYNCSYDGQGSTCLVAWRDNTGIMGDYAIDYTHNGTCADIIYNGGHNQVQSCAGSGGYQTTVCYALFDGQRGYTWNSVFPNSKDNLAGTIYSYCPL